MATISAVDQFKNLEPNLRCAALVGQFLQTWSALEGNINDAIEKGLNLTDLQGAILTKNIQFRDKLNILKTLAAMMCPGRERFQKLLTEIGDMSLDRNMMAHDAFLADKQGDGVRFLVVKARGKLGFPPTRWSIADFFARYIAIADLSVEIETLTYALKPVTMASVLRQGAGEPINWLYELAHPRPPNHQAQSAPGLSPHPAKRKTKKKTRRPPQT